jgi:hypothetical protein
LRTLGGAGNRLSVQSILTEDAGFQERLHQSQDSPVLDATTRAVHRGHVINLIEARRDDCFEYPLVMAGAEVVNLSAGVLGSALRAKAVTARLEVRLKDWLEYQLERGLHGSIDGGRGGPWMKRGIFVALPLAFNPRVRLLTREVETSAKW